MVRGATVSTYVGRAAASSRVLLSSSVLAALGMLAVCGAMLLELRRDAWERADHAAANVLQAVASDIDRNIELYDLSLQAVVDGLRTPAVMATDPELRRLILFDRAATAKGLGVIFVTDKDGRIVANSRGVVPRLQPITDRDYFVAHRERDVGLFVSEPFVARATGESVVALSRRVDDAQGGFAGVVTGTIKLSYLETLLARIDVGRNGTVLLFREDGGILMRKPVAAAELARSFVNGALYRQTRTANEGRVLGPSTIDGIERAVTFRRVGSLPLFLAVAIGVEDIVGPWRTKAFTIGLMVLLMTAVTIGLACLFRREIERRARAEAAMVQANAELAALSVTDALTGLANRRRFDAVLAREHRRTQRVGRPLALLVLDVDHFKACNDRYGHAAGDVVLAGLARAVVGVLRAPGGLACRVGGEEFAVILPDTDRSAAFVAAEAIHRAVAKLSPPGGEGGAPVTVSIGLACCAPGGRTTAAELFTAADAALYDAKRQGRNLTAIAGAEQQDDLARVA